MGLKDAYYGLEERYYKFLDWLDGKGIPIYKVVDPVDKVVPSFVLVLILLGIILIGIIYAIAFSLGINPSNNQIIVTFIDKGGNANVPGLNVNISVPNEDSFSLTTNAVGAILFEAKPDTSITFTGEINDNEFEESIYVTDSLSYTIELPFSTSLQNISFTLAPTDGAYLSSPVNISFSCSNTRVLGPDPIYNYTGSTIDVDVDPDCGTLLVDVTSNDYEAVESRAVFSGDVIPLNNLIGGGNCSLVVSVLDSMNNPVDGSNITIYLGEYGLPVYNEYNVLNGQKIFSGLTAVTYKVVVSKSGYLADPQLVTFSRDGESKSINVNMKVAGEGSGYISAKILDKSDAEPLTGAKVCFWEQNGDKQGTPLGCQETDSEGLATVAVPDTSKEFWINATRTFYKGETVKEAIANSTPKQIYLEKIDPEDRCLSVKVVDFKDKEVANASVYLYDSENNMLANDFIITDDNGVARCFYVDDGNYKVYTYKASYNIMSDSFIFTASNPGDEYSIKVLLGIPEATLRIMIHDEYDRPIPNAIVKLYDAYGSELQFEGGMHSDALGEFIKTGLRADKKLYYVVEKSPYERYTSIAKFLTPDVENLDEIVLDRLELDRTPKIIALGTYTTDDKIVNKVVAGELYKVRYKILLPRDEYDDDDETEEKIYKKAYATFVAGVEDVVEKEPFYIERIERSGLAHVMKGRIYNSEDEDETTDESNMRQTLDEAKEGLAFEDEVKWVQLSWDLTNMEVPSGTLFAEAYFRVRDTAKENTKFTFLHSLATTQKKKSDALFWPLDEDGELNYVTNNKSQYYVFSGKGQQICDETGDVRFCIESTIFDIEDEIIADMLGDTPYIANVGKNYLFNFSLMNANEKPLTNYRVIIDNPQKTLFFTESSIKSASNEEDENTLLTTEEMVEENNYEIIHRSTIPLEKNNVIRGNINLVPRKLGNSSIRFSVVEDNDTIYTKEFYVNVTADKDMNVTIVPEVLPSYTYLNLEITATDADTGEGIENAKVYIKDVANTVLISGEYTAKDGKVIVKLPSQKPNMKLFVTVYKDEYKPYEEEMKVAADFLSLVPNSLNINLDVSETWGQDQITLKNSADFPVTIKQISLSGDFDEYINVKEINDSLENTFLDKVIVQDHDFIMPVKLRLTEFASYLESNVEYEGLLKFSVQRENALTGEWYYEVPVKVNITLGDGLDSTDCLGLDVDTGKLTSTDSKQVHDVLTITNGCMINGKPASLNNLEAKIKWSGNSLGSIVFGKDERETKLQTAYYRSLAAVFSPDAEETYTVNLVPKSGSVVGKGSVEVELRASFMTAGGLQFVENSVKFDVDVLKLHDCFSFELPEAESDTIISYRNKDQTFKMKNICDSDLEIRLDTLPDREELIRVEPKEFSLKAGEEKTLKVKVESAGGSTPAGVYLLEIRGKTAGHTYQGIKVGLEAFRIFLKPLETDCIIMDNYEYDIYDTDATLGSQKETQNETVDSEIWSFGYDKDNSGELIEDDAQAETQQTSSEVVSLEGMRFGYIINRCYKVKVSGSYPLEVYSKFSVTNDVFGSLLPAAVTGVSTGMASWATGETKTKSSQGSK